MSKHDEYATKLAASTAAAAAATSERDRTFHLRAVAVYRKVIRGFDEAAERAALQPTAKGERQKPVRHHTALATGTRS